MDLSNPIFHDEDKARKHLEDLRWPDGPVCPWCGLGEPVKALGGKSMGKGWYHCTDCRQKFTVRVGTLYERSKIPLHKWVMATHLLCASKKGISAHQLHRMLNVTYKTAWFMAHRIRESMREVDPEPMGGEGQKVQADETYFGKTAEPQERSKYASPVTKRGRGGPANKRAILALVHDGKARTFHVNRATAKNVRSILFQNVKRESELHTDESSLYTVTGREFARHRTVHHSSGQYVKAGVTTNNVENYFSIFKRGMKGVYQHCAEKHLHRYLGEFDFRYNSRQIEDTDRAELALKGIEGKRLTYRRIGEGQEGNA